MIAVLCAEDPAAAGVGRAAEGFASRGYRSPGVARTGASGAWRLLGVLPLADPPREDSAPTVAAARELGLELKMVTGDQAAIGREIARRVGLGERILDAAGVGNPAEGAANRRPRAAPARAAQPRSEARGR